MFLVEPSMEYERQLLAFRQDFLDSGQAAEGTGSLLRFPDIREWLDKVEADRDPARVPPERVPATQYLYVRECDGKIVGMLQIRHCLNEFLERYSGHIGYCVCPGERRKGYATRMLRDALPLCRAFGIESVLIACARENEGSRRTILKNGGVYLSTVYLAERDILLERYRIDLPR